MTTMQEAADRLVQAFRSSTRRGPEDRFQYRGRTRHDLDECLDTVRLHHPDLWETLFFQERVWPLDIPSLLHRGLTTAQLDRVIAAADEHLRVINTYDQPQAIYPSLIRGVQPAPSPY